MAEVTQAVSPDDDGEVDGDYVDVDDDIDVDDYEVDKIYVSIGGLRCPL